MADKKQLLDLIKLKVREKFTKEIFESLKTEAGNTQEPERKYISIIKN